MIKSNLLIIFDKWVNTWTAHDQIAPALLFTMLTFDTAVMVAGSALSAQGTDILDSFSSLSSGFQRMSLDEECAMMKNFTMNLLSSNINLHLALEHLWLDSKHNEQFANHFRRVLSWIKDSPKHAIVIILTVTVLSRPGVISTPVLWILGFRTDGIFSNIWESSEKARLIDQPTLWYHMQFTAEFRSFQNSMKHQRGFGFYI